MDVFLIEFLTFSSCLSFRKRSNLNLASTLNFKFLTNFRRKLLKGTIHVPFNFQLNFDRLIFIIAHV